MAREPAGREGAAPGPDGIGLFLPASVLVAAAALIVAFVALSSWLADAIAIAIAVLALGAMARYLQRIGSARRAGREPRRASGAARDLAVTDEAHPELSPHDLPEGTPARRELERRRSAA